MKSSVTIIALFLNVTLFGQTDSSFCYYKNGNIHQETRQKESSSLYSFKQYYSNGILRAEGTKGHEGDIGGLLLDIKTYYLNGAIRSIGKLERKENVFILNLYDKEGNLTSKQSEFECNFGGSITSEIINYDETGKIIGDLKTTNHIDFCEYADDGGLIKAIEAGLKYDATHKKEIYEYYYDGQLRRVYYFNNDDEIIKLHSYYHQYCPNGSTKGNDLPGFPAYVCTPNNQNSLLLSSAMSWKNNKLHGIQKYYNQDGVLRGEENYIDGVMSK